MVALQVSTAAPGKRDGLLIPVQVKWMVFSTPRPLSRALSFIPVTRLAAVAFYVLKNITLVSYVSSYATDQLKFLRLPRKCGRGHRAGRVWRGWE